MRPREFLALIALAALWGGSYLFIRIAVPELGPLPLMAARVVIAGALLAVPLVARRQRLDLRRNARDLLLLGALNAAIPFTLIAAAELHVTVSLAAILSATVPLFSVVAGAVWLRQPVSPRTAAGLVLGLIGVGVLVGWSPLPATRQTVLSVAALLVASAFYGFAGVYAKRRLAHLPSSLLALGQQLGAAAWLVVPALVFLPSQVPSARAVLALGALATLSTAVAYLLYFYLIERIGPTRTPTVTYLIPVFGTLWGALFLGESITAGMVAGMTLVLASVLLANGVRMPRRLSEALPLPSLFARR